eukprot:CAMPEP_0201908410 /NCGR_PEP_ID=MMETSP0903-20130614/530_1 /ASSEMBLY_ACC=CAM_ASM_000552 /TAXON_ID=420261 /ORGANISM="Thalassiosira antarctica, Strain CCMP982" /LENGTH=48 /DNA_ID= /DNA_START= /DNA_END= /DNA_ORIENTATION=
MTVYMRVRERDLGDLIRPTSKIFTASSPELIVTSTVPIRGLHADPMAP